MPAPRDIETGLAPAMPPPPKLAPAMRLDPVLRELLLGTACPRSPLQLLRGQRDVLRAIWLRVVEEYWDACLEARDGDPRLALDAVYVVPSLPEPLEVPSWLVVAPASHARRVEPAVVFPAFTGINVNMMPFVVHERRAQLPAELQTYMHVIDACVRTMSRPPENTPIGYLTVHESDVEDGASQRRPGLHVESPGLARGAAAAALAPGAHHHWGRGIVMKDGSLSASCGRFSRDFDRENDCHRRARRSLSGGIFMASSVDDTCRLWNCRVRDDQGDIVGPGGDCERLRPLLKHVETDTLRANELAWMSDMTPHESLPLKGGGRRQYFRLVVGEVSAWYAAHSTPNPNFDLASAPGGPAVVAGDKFANAGAYAWTRGAAAAGAYDPADDRARTSFRKAMARAGLEHRLDFFAACGVRRFADLRGKGAELRRGLDHWDQTRLRYALKKPGVLWYETAPDSGEE